MKDLQAYLDRRAPEAARASRGVPEEELKTLELELGLSLPPCYRQYLRLFGADPSPILGPLETDFSFQAATRALKSHGRALLPSFLLIGASSAGELDDYLDLSSGDRPVVVRLPPRDAQLRFDSFPNLRELLFHHALRNVRVDRLPTQASFAQVSPGPFAAGDRLELLARLAQKLGWDSVNPEAKWAPGYESERLALAAYRPPGGALFLSLGAEEILMESLSDLLTVSLGISRTR